MHRTRNHFQVLMWIVLPLGFCPAVILGQGPTGEITGTVRDQTAGVVPNATVKLVNSATGATREILTNESGIYNFPALLPGTYNVTAGREGFQTQTRSGIPVQVQQTVRVDFTLQVGEVAQNIEVSASAMQLSKDDATVGQVIENRRIVELPLNGRNYLQLTALSPGVNINSSASGGATNFMGGQRSRQSISVNGQRGQFNNFTLDGLGNTDTNFNTYIFLPSIDALQEFKVQSATYPADQGFAVSQINVTTKSGSNEIHGSVFEFLRNAAFDAKNFFDKPKEPIPGFRRNQFGGTVGGPIMKNRLFYFVNYEGLRENKALTQTSTLPVPALRAGDFSGQRTIYDPLTRARQPDNRIVAQPFAGNRIPQSRFHPISQKLLQFWPTPNLPGAVQNFLSNEPREVGSDQLMVRLDYQQNNNLSWYGRWNYAEDSEYQPRGIPGQGAVTATRPDQILGGNTWVIRPNMVNDLRFGWSRLDNKLTGPNSGKNDINGKILQIPGFNPSGNPAFWGIPQATFTGYSGFGDVRDVFLTRNNMFEWKENLNWIRGKHVLKLGLHISRIHFENIGNQLPSGTLVFNGFATANPPQRTTTGESVADFLLGYSSETGGAAKEANARLRSSYWSGYISDSVKLTGKLNLDLGLRYEYLQPFKNINDESANIADLSINKPILVRASNLGTDRDPYEGEIVRFRDVTVVRDGRLGPGLYPADRNNWAPRLGLAYSPNQDTVIRAGFGVFYSMIDLGNSIYDMARSLAGLRRENNDVDFPDLTLDAPFRGSTGGGIGAGGLIEIVQPLILANSNNMLTSYVNQWSLTVQRNLGRDLMVELGYVGSQGHRLKKMNGRNEPLPGPGIIDSRRPYGEFGWIQYPDTVGNSNFNSLQVKVEQGFRNGLTVLAAYTFGKSIDDTSGVRPGGGDTLFVNNPFCVNSCERGRSAFDARQRFVLSGLYQLPFGRGRKTGLRSLLTGGWQLGSIITLESGLPETPSAGSDVANVGVGHNNRPDATGINPSLGSKRSVDRFFNTDAFRIQPIHSYGNAGRNVIEGPGIINADVSVMKDFHVSESKRFELRAEGFNIANHPIFGFPVANLRSGAYGKLTGTRVDSRQIQLALRFVF
ncbi:MAG: carboxypeptidase regulatory-like domain-containing protein [Acidobacteria bacterium]|nr:carboxypeptidase regulatory-like domain-containing protein [Acidobacteriota bacterium]